MSRAMRLRIFARSLLLQAFWSFERMQGLGFAFSVEPWLRRCYPEGAERRAAQARHAGFFNTQPYMASFIIGMVCALEEEAVASPEAQRTGKLERMLALKTAASGALAGIGDALFWGALRPFSAALALLCGLAFLGRGRHGSLYAVPLVYLAAYNIFALSVRWGGLGWGYAWGDQIAARLKGFAWQAWIRRLRWAGAVCGLAAVALMLAAAGGQPGQRRVGIVTLAAFFLVLSLRRIPASAYRVYAATCLLGSAAAAAGWI